MKPADYLAGLAGARALYAWLYRDAVAMLPPPVDGVTSPLESRTPLREVGKSLGWSQGVVQKELARLVNFRWVRDGAMPRFLGQRVGGVMHLMADLEAEQATGDKALVTRVVLQLQPPAPVERKPAPTSADKRGTNRGWSKDDVTGEW